MNCIEFYHWKKIKPDMLPKVTSIGNYYIGNEQIGDESHDEMFDLDVNDAI